MEGGPAPRGASGRGRRGGRGYVRRSGARPSRSARSAPGPPRRAGLRAAPPRRARSRPRDPGGSTGYGPAWGCALSPCGSAGARQQVCAVPRRALHARQALSRVPRSEAARRGGLEPCGPSRGQFPPPPSAVRALRAERGSSRTEVRGALENVAVVLSARLRAGFGDGTILGSGSALPFDLKAATKAGGCGEAVPELRAALLTHPGQRRAVRGCASCWEPSPAAMVGQGESLRGGGL